MTPSPLLPYAGPMALALFIFFSPSAAMTARFQPAPGNGAVRETASLETCIQTALENNHLRPASRYALEAAEAQHRQVLASYWPQLDLQAGYQLMDDPSNFLFPASDVTLPMGGSIPVTIPGVGTVDVSSISVPEQNVKLMDEESYRVSLEGTWLIYDGGLRKGYREQTEGMVAAMEQASRSTDLEIVDTVRQYYYGGVLATRLHLLGRETLERMEATLALTETLYREGSGRVLKTDWLDNTVMVETLRSMVALLEKNELMARAALAGAMGMAWDNSVIPSETELLYTPVVVDPTGLVGSAYRFNPDWARIEAGLMAAQGALGTAKSGYYPKLAVMGELFKWWNDYDAGMATPQNKEGWTIGIGIELPLFSGFLTQSKVDEARARIAKLKEEQILLREGLGLQIRDAVLSLDAAGKTCEATLSAMEAAVESRDLNIRAYQHGLVDTQDVVTAQLTEALMSARHYKARYDHIALKSQLNRIVGTEVLQLIQ